MCSQTSETYSIPPPVRKHQQLKKTVPMIEKLNRLCAKSSIQPSELQQLEIAFNLFDADHDGEMYVYFVISLLLHNFFVVYASRKHLPVSLYSVAKMENDNKMNRQRNLLDNEKIATSLFLATPWYCLYVAALNKI